MLPWSRPPGKAQQSDQGDIVSEGLEDEGDLESLGTKNRFVLAEMEMRHGSGEESWGLNVQEPLRH